MSSYRSKRLKERNSKAIIMFLSALCAVGAYTTLKIVDTEQKKNAELKKSYDVARKEVMDLQRENAVLRNYANAAQGFAGSIVPLLSENDSSCEEPNCPKCKEIEEANKAELDNYNNAIKTLGIDPKVLLRLQEGPQND